VVGEREALLVRGNALLVLYHTLDHVDGVNSTCNTNSSAAVGRQHPWRWLAMLVTERRFEHLLDPLAAGCCFGMRQRFCRRSGRFIAEDKERDGLALFPFSSKSSFIALPVSSCCIWIFLALTCSRLFIITLTATLCFVFRISVEINVTASFNQLLRNGLCPLWAARKSGVIQLAS
jgi:hypothetical protein